MRVIGVIAEFNPLHAGHLAHLADSRVQAGGDAAVVCVMSGDFVQRGEAAVWPKHVRAEAAVRGGADLVLELPLPWCVSSAERFASGAVGLLDGLGVITDLSFGSEAGKVEPLQELAQAALDPAVLGRIKERLSEGMNFAAAREQVLRETVGEQAGLLGSPNNILGVEYCKALLARHSAIQPMTTRRTQTVHDGFASGELRSAAQLRAMMAAGEDITPYLPASSVGFPAQARAAECGFITMSSLETAMMARLRALKEEDFFALPDATEGLGSRVYKAVREEGSTEAILSAVKTKRYPLSRLRRMLLCAALGIRAEMLAGTPPYARVLAASKTGLELLRGIGEAGTVPVVNKPAAVRHMSEETQKIFGLTADARDFYVLGYARPEDRRGGSDWRTSPVILT